MTEKIFQKIQKKNLAGDQAQKISEKVHISLCDKRILFQTPSYLMQIRVKEGIFIFNHYVIISK